MKSGVVKFIYKQNDFPLLDKNEDFYPKIQIQLKK